MLPLSAPIALARGGASAGTITGMLMNGTHSNAPIAGQPVTVQGTTRGQARDLATTTTDGQGRFSFGGLAADNATIYAVYTRFQGGLYASGPITLATASNQQAMVTAYDATTSDANLRITNVVTLIRQPRPTVGLIGVGEFVTFHNSGTTAFVGGTAPANGLPMGLLRFALPSGATNLTPGVGFIGSQVIQVDTGFGATATVPPGDSEFAFAFDMSYASTQALVSYKAEYPSAQVAVLAPPTMLVEARDFSARGITDAFGSRYQVFWAASVRANASATLRLWDLPTAGEPSNLDFRALLALVAVLALLIVGLLLRYLKRGNLAAPSRLVALENAAISANAPARQRTAAAGRAAGRQTEHQALLRELLTLERARAAGTLDQATYRQREAETRAALRALLAEEDRPATPTAPDVAAPASADVATPQARTMSGGGR